MTVLHYDYFQVVTDGFKFTFRAYGPLQIERAVYGQVLLRDLRRSHLLLLSDIFHNAHPYFFTFLANSL